MAHNPQIIAHRGSAILAPENTRDAFDLAISFNADRLEADIRTSSDGIPVIFHDAQLDRTTNGSGYVSDYTLSELKSLDAAWHFRDSDNQSYRGRQIEILSLSELLSEYTNIPVNLDIKHPNPEFASTVAGVIQEHRPGNDVLVASFHDDVVSNLRHVAPDIPTAATRDETQDLYASRRRLTRWSNFMHEFLLERENLSNNNVAGYKSLQIPTQVKFGPFTIDLTDRAFIEHVHRQNLTIGYWTINDPEEMHALAEKGADGLVTDRVDIAHKLFKNRLSTPPD